jgi:hypothetical protein
METQKSHQYLKKSGNQNQRVKKHKSFFKIIQLEKKIHRQLRYVKSYPADRNEGSSSKGRYGALLFCKKSPFVVNATYISGLRG